MDALTAEEFIKSKRFSRNTRHVTKHGPGTNVAILRVLAIGFFASCGSAKSTEGGGSGSASGAGGVASSGGVTGLGDVTGSGGVTGAGGDFATGGVPGSGGAAGVAGSVGSGSGGASGGMGGSTPAQIVQQLEQTGVLPVLDRGSDLAGPDTNDNGIRDDIDAFVATQGYAAPQLAAVEQLARSFQAAVTLQTISTDAARPVATQFNSAITCTYQRFPDTQSAHSICATLEEVTANTEARVRSYLKFNNALNGTVSTLPRGNSCDQ